VLDIDKFISLLEVALRKEEEELNGIQPVHTRDESIRISVRNYNEQWLQPLVFKQSILHGVSNYLDFEKGKVDYCLLDEEGKVTVAIELKGPFDVTETATVAAYWVNEIQSDFSKQIARRKLPQCQNRYVVLLPWGDDGHIEEWQRGQMHSEIISDWESRIDLPPLVKSIQLNNGKMMRILCYKINRQGEA